MSNRRRIQVNRRLKPSNDHHPSPRLHRKVVVSRSSNTKPILIKRCNSEPALMIEDKHRHMTPPGDSNCMMFRNRVFTDVFSSSPELLPNSPDKREYRRGTAYNKDAKVVVKVMVEGSVGPIRALVKLGSSVDETIKLVMNKYNAEGRSPGLDQDAMTSFELHHSNFSLQCLDKSNMIGEIGTRSFYMRKSINGAACSNASIDSNIVAAVIGEDSVSRSSSSFLPGFIYQKFKKIIQRTSKIWRVLDCFGG